MDSSSTKHTSEAMKTTARVFSKRNRHDDTKTGLNLVSSETIEHPYQLDYKSLLMEILKLLILYKQKLSMELNLIFRSMVTYCKVMLRS